MKIDCVSTFLICLPDNGERGHRARHHRRRHRRAASPAISQLPSSFVPEPIDRTADGIVKDPFPRNFVSAGRIGGNRDLRGRGQIDRENRRVSFVLRRLTNSRLLRREGHVPLFPRKTSMFDIRDNERRSQPANGAPFRTLRARASLALRPAHFTPPTVH